MPHWFCLHHMAVEPDSGCAHAERLGPYQSEQDAAHALQRAKARTEAWDNDDRWNDDKRWENTADLED